MQETFAVDQFPNQLNETGHFACAAEQRLFRPAQRGTMVPARGTMVAPSSASATWDGAAAFPLLAAAVCLLLAHWLLRRLRLRPAPGSGGNGAEVGPDGRQQRRVKVTDILVYPVKAMRGVAVRSAVMDGGGFVGDRAYMLVEERLVYYERLVEGLGDAHSEWELLSKEADVARAGEYPEAALLRPELPTGAGIRIRFPDAPAAPRCEATKFAFVSIFSSLDTVGCGSIRSSESRAAEAGSPSPNESLVSKITA